MDRRGGLRCDVLSCAVLSCAVICLKYLLFEGCDLPRWLHAQKKRRRQYMYTDIFTYIYIYMYINIYIFIHIYIHVRVRLCLSLCLFVVFACCVTDVQIVR